MKLTPRCFEITTNVPEEWLAREVLDMDEGTREQLLALLQAAGTDFLADESGSLWVAIVIDGERLEIRRVSSAIAESMQRYEMPCPCRRSLRVERETVAAISDGPAVITGTLVGGAVREYGDLL